MQIYVLGLALIILAVLLVVIGIKTAAMIRARRARLEAGPSRWQSWLAPADIGAADEAGPGTKSEVEGGDAARSTAGRVRHEPRRRLVGLREADAPGSRAWLITPGYFAEMEIRLAAAFEALCDGDLTLAGYSAAVEQEYGIAIRLQANLGPLADDALHAEMSDVMAALEWCRNWARTQRAARDKAVDARGSQQD